jgi:outer membrane protein assembly factor BamB
MASHLYVGIRGSVVALDRSTGTELWRTKLKGTDFVNVAFLDGQLFAATRGEAFCLDETTGNVLWNNKLEGLGWGVVTFASASGPSTGNIVTAAEKERQKRAAAAAAAST